MTKVWTKEQQETHNMKALQTSEILRNTPKNEGIILCFFTGQRMSEKEAVTKNKKVKKVA